MVSVCKICGCSTSNLSNHVLYKHVREGDIDSLESYYRKFVYTGDLEKLGKCVTCGKPVPFISVNKGYRTHCCRECSQKDPEVKRRKKENTRKALIKKYGVVNAGQVPGSREKTKVTKKARYGSEKYNNPEKYKKTMLERYGVENPAKSEEIQERKKKTNLERYGNVFPANSEHGRKIAKQTNLERYGTEWPQQNPEIKAKSVETSVKRYGGVLMGSPRLRKKCTATWKVMYGTDYPNQNPEQRQKAAKTCIQKFGKPNYLCLPEVHEKARKVMKDRYGCEYAMQVPEFLDKQKKHSLGVYFLREYTFNSTGKTLSYLSNMERTFLEDCDESGLDIDRGDQVRYDFQEKSHIFNVDFRINFQDGTKQLVEIKGTNIFYFQALKTGKQEAKNKAAEQYSLRMNYRPYLYLLNYEKGDIGKWILKS